MARFPDEKLSIVILSNDKSLNTYSLALGIVDIIFAIKDDSDQVVQSNPERLVETEIMHSSNQEEYVGSFYSEELNVLVKISIVNEQLRISMGRNKVHDLVFIDQDKFKADLMNKIEAQFLRNEQNEIRGINASSVGVRELLFEKVN